MDLSKVSLRCRAANRLAVTYPSQALGLASDEQVGLLAIVLSQVGS